MTKEYPEFCFIINDVTREVIKVKRYEMGYYPYDGKTYDISEPEYAQKVADNLNAYLGVDKSTAEAMKIGSLFGWDVPGANPEFWKGKI